MKNKILRTVFMLFVSLMVVGNIQAGEICIDEVEHCNDVKLVYSHIQGEVVELHGYEYGCGANDRIFSGSATLVGNTARIGLTGSFDTTDPKLALRYYNVDLGSNSGTGSYSYNDGSVWSGTSTINVVPCPAANAEVFVEGSDSSAQ